VYKIERISDNMVCAGKFFKMKLSDMETSHKEMCKQELDILQKVNHPFLIKYIEEFKFNKGENEKLCIVTKYVSGGNLQ
jgi:NIMA (never in mitosis gene a)-related kinase